MARLLLEIVVRSTLLAGGTACVLWALRIRIPALRHAAWAAVVAVMLVLPAWSLAGPSLHVPLLPPATAQLASESGGVPDSTGTASGASATARGADTPAGTPPPPSKSVPWVSVAVGFYLVGALVLLARLAVGTVQASRLRRGAVMRGGRATSARCATPVTVGWLAPVLILPDGWERWPAGRIDAVVTHEQEHARRRDPLVQWLALLNRGVFWFHPLAWWLERRLANLAEQVCDAAVIRAGHAPQDYSDCLMDMARELRRQGRRLNLAGMAMPGSNLPERMRYIFEEQPMRPHSRARVFSTFVLCAAASVVCAAGMLTPRSNGVGAVPTIPNAPVRQADVSLDRVPAAPGSQASEAAPLPEATTTAAAVRPETASTREPADKTPTKPDSTQPARPDLSGHWKLVTTTSAGRGRGGTGEAGVEREVRTIWASGAPVNCGPDCTLTQDDKTLTISRLGTPDAVTLYDNGVVTLNLDGSDSSVTQTRGTHYVVQAKWDGETLVVIYQSPWSTVTQVLSIANDKLKVVTDFGVGDAPVTFTYVKA